MHLSALSLSNWFNMADANNVNLLLLLSELNAQVKMINEASQSNGKLNFKKKIV